MKPSPLAYLAIATSTLGWGLSPIFIRYLNTPYDPFTQAFIRYGSAAGLLLGISLLFFRAEFFRILRRPGVVLGLAALNILMQTCWTLGCFYSKATTAQLITKLETLFVILISFVLFHEERAVIRSPVYLLGTLLCFAGAGGVLIDDPGTSLVPAVDFATGLLVLMSVLWAIYAVWGKHIVGTMHPVPMFTLVALCTTAGFGALSLTVGDPHTLLEAGPRITAIALISGTLPIAIAHCTFHFAQRQLGSAFCSSLLLLNPLFTHAIALAIWEDESLVWIQWLGAAILLGGGLLVLRARRNIVLPAAPPRA